MIREEGALPCTLTLTIPVEATNWRGATVRRAEVVVDMLIEQSGPGRVAVVIGEPYKARPDALGAPE